MADLLLHDHTRLQVRPVDFIYLLRKPTPGGPGRLFSLMKNVVLPLVLLLVLTSPALGAPAISCHCFQDRSFDPAEPRRIEPYLLATTRNSLLAIVFGQSKKEIVRLRMAGTTGADLWIAYYVATKAGTPAGELLRSRGKADAWLPVLAARGIDAGQTGPFFGRAMTTGGNDQALADAATDEMLGAAGAVPGELRQFRQRGADTGEIILALLLAQRLGRPAIDLHAEVQAGQATWGGLIDSVGIRPAEMEEAVRTLLRQNG